MPEDIHDVQDGQQILDALQPHLNQLAVVPDRLSSANRPLALKSLEEQLDGLEPDLSFIKSIFSDAVQADLDAEFQILRQGRKATSFANSTYLRTEGGKTSNALLVEAYALQALGFEALKQLALSKRVTQQEADKIFAGRGQRDLIGDLEAMPPILQLHWSILELAQTLKAEGEELLTQAKIKRMTFLADILPKPAPEPAEAPPTDWRRTTIRCWTLLETTWDRFRASAADSYTRQGLPAKAAALVSLNALGA